MTREFNVNSRTATNHAPAETNHVLSRHAGLFCLVARLQMRSGELRISLFAACNIACPPRWIINFFVSSCHALAPTSSHSTFTPAFFFNCACKILEFMWIFFVHEMYWQIHPINLTNALSWPPLKDAAIGTAAASTPSTTPTLKLGYIHDFSMRRLRKRSLPFFSNDGNALGVGGVRWGWKWSQSLFSMFWILWIYEAMIWNVA